MTNIVKLAEMAGEEEYRAPGHTYYPALQITHLLRCAKMESYSDNARARLRRHTLLYGPTGATKSTCAASYLRDYIGAINIASPVADHASAPLYLDLGGSGITWERMRGGCTMTGAYIPPLLEKTDYMLNGELFSFLGHSPMQQAERMDTMNEVLEEGIITVALNKMFNLSEKKRQRLEEDLQDTNVLYNARDAILSYKVKGVYVGASRFFTKDQREALSGSGFLSRLCISEWNPNPEQEFHYRRHQFGKRNTILQEKILAFNQKAWQCKFEEVRYPPIEMVDSLIESFFATYERIGDETGKRIGDIASSRDTIDAAQLLTASAIARAVEKRETPGIVHEVVYEADDLQWAAKRSLSRLNHLYDAMMGESEPDVKKAEAADLLVDFLRTHDEMPLTIATRDVVKWAKTTQRAAPATCFRRLKVLREAGDITSDLYGEAGEYRVNERLLRAAGFTIMDADNDIHADLIEDARRV